MAAPRHKTEQYTAEQFVESCGAILFQQSTKQICLVRSADRDVWLLAKGRRNVNERRIDAALREAREETGFKCRAMLVDLNSRVTPWEEGPQAAGTVTPDEPRRFQGVCEPFMITHRTLPENAGIKLIHWYIATIDETATKGQQEELYSEARLFNFDEAVRTLTFSTDRDVVTKAIEIFETTISGAARKARAEQ